MNVDNTGEPDKERTRGCLPTYHQHQGREGGSNKKRGEEEKKKKKTGYKILIRRAFAGAWSSASFAFYF